MMRALLGAVVVSMWDAATAWEQDNSYVLSLQQLYINMN